MLSIRLIETGHTGLFTATTETATFGSLIFRLSGPYRITVDSLEVPAGINAQSVAYALLDALHEYAFDLNAAIDFRCPKAKSLNDQQITHEVQEVSPNRASAA